jgi:hypothetical protein
MEMTVRRAAGIAVAAFALLLLAWPPRPAGPSYGTQVRRLTSAVDRARLANVSTRDTLRAVESAIWSRQVRDSVQRVIRGWPGADRNRIVVDARVPGSLQRHIAANYTVTHASLPRLIAHPVLVVVDTGRAYRLRTTLSIEGGDAAAPYCATVVRVRVSDEALSDPARMARDVQRALGTNFPQARHLGLCGFESAFGLPSPAVRRWLIEREYRPVGGGYDPQRPPLPMRQLSDYINPYFGSRSDNGALFLRARGCAAGREEQCLDVLAPVSDRPLGVVTNVASDWRWFGWYWQGSYDLMNALATSLGTDRFAVLWRGNAAPPEAYRQLTGVPVDSLARRVLMGKVPPMRAGASVSVIEFVITLLIAAAFAGLATLSHPRRRR